VSSWSAGLAEQVICAPVWGIHQNIGPCTGSGLSWSFVRGKACDAEVSVSGLSSSPMVFCETGAWCQECAAAAYRGGEEGGCHGRKRRCGLYQLSLLPLLLNHFSLLSMQHGHMGLHFHLSMPVVSLRRICAQATTRSPWRGTGPSWASP
jgi:hypothetical protein